jgi:hypothetical protein
MSNGDRSRRKEKQGSGLDVDDDGGVSRDNHFKAVGWPKRRQNSVLTRYLLGLSCLSLHWWPTLRQCEKRWLTHIASEAKTAAFEKTGRRWKKRLSKAAAIDKTGHQNRPPLTKAAIKNGQLWGNVATVEKRWLPFKLTQIASEAKAVAFEKSGRHWKERPSKAAIKSGHLWGNVAGFKLATLPQRAKWPPLTKAAIKSGRRWHKQPSKMATFEAMWPLLRKRWLTHIASEAKEAACEKSGRRWKKRPSKAAIKSGHQKWTPLKQCGRFLTGHIALEGKVAAVEKAAADEKSGH